MHVSSVAKAVQIIIYASVSSSMPRPYWPGVWQVMHDASLPPLPSSCPHLLLYTPNRTAVVSPFFEKHLSTTNLDPESAHHPEEPSLRNPFGIFSRVFYSCLSVFFLVSPFASPTLRLERHTARCHMKRQTP